MQARSLALIAGLALAGVAWYALGRSAGAPPSPGLPSPAAVAPHIAPAAQDETAPVAPAEFEGRRESAAVAAEAPSEVPADAAAAAPQPALRLSGTVVVMNWTGAELAPIDGRFQLSMWEKRGAQNERVEVTRGEWSIDLELAEAPEIGVLELATTQDVLFIEQPEEGSRFAFPDGGRLEIRARKARPSILHVVDTHDGRALDRVELLRASWMDSGHPSPQTAARARSR